MNPELLAQIFKINCGQGTGIFTGLYHCPFIMKNTKTLVYFPDGFTFAEAISLAYLQTLQLQGKAVVLAKVTAFEDLTAADNINTDNGTNIETKAGESPYKYAFTFRNGTFFDQQIRKIQSFGAYGCIYLDADLSIIATSTSDEVKPISCGQIAVDPIKTGDGAATGFSRLWHQELYRSERDIDLTWIIQPNHDIRLASLDGVNQVEFAFAVVPGAGDEEIVFTAKTKADKKSVDMGGLELTDVKFTIDGAPVALDGDPVFDDVTGRYTGQLAAALVISKPLTLGFASAYNTGFIKKGNRIYGSNTATAVVVA